MAKAVKVSYKGKQLRQGFVKRLIDKLPVKLRAPILRRAADFMMRKFSIYPVYKWVKRRSAYGMQAGGPGFFSKKQRRFVMASLRAGRNLKTGEPMAPGGPHRNDFTKNSWTIEGKGVNIAIVNTAPHAKYLFEPRQQARQPRLVGWETTQEMADANRGAMAADLLQFAREQAPKEVERILFEG